MRITNTTLRAESASAVLVRPSPKIAGASPANDPARESWYEKIGPTTDTMTACRSASSLTRPSRTNQPVRDPVSGFLAHHDTSYWDSCFSQTDPCPSCSFLSESVTPRYLSEPCSPALVWFPWMLERHLDRSFEYAHRRQSIVCQLQALQFLLRYWYHNATLPVSHRQLAHLATFQHLLGAPG